MLKQIQQVGNFLSKMIMPVIGAFIAWGLITAFFIPDGWFPNETLAALVDPMIYYLLPILVAFSGGKLVYGARGGIVGAIATMGAIVAVETPMFLGAMIMGPFGGWLIKKLDSLYEGKTKPGFEMLINNYAVGILGALLAIFSLLVVGPFVELIMDILAAMVDFLVETGMLFLTALIIEPAKILFLNNAINHGVLTPLGTADAEANGKSILFLLETNPGPGLGVLLGYTFFGRGMAKKTAPGAIIIQFLGGIHEIYFPYVLMKPKLFLSVILGGMAGTFTFTLFNVGLVAPASPGSIFAILTMTPKGDFIGVLAGVSVATLVSFLVTMLILKSDPETDDEELEAAVEKVDEMKGKTSTAAHSLLNNKETIEVVFACDAGMGSSAMGASILKEMIKDNDIDYVNVSNKAVSELEDNIDIVISQEIFSNQIKERCPNSEMYFVKNFLDKKTYQEIVSKLNR